MTAAATPAGERLAPIEGLRAYLALWVLFSHAMQWSGYPETGLAEPWAWARQGFLAVKIFMIISGFVIFHRLASRRESAGPFLLHRFFRIYPLYILLFLACLPLSAERLWSDLPPAAQIGALEPAYDAWSAQPGLHVALHVFMLHGLPSESLVPASAYAFLPPAWSIAVEFQFYLLAPLVFLLAARGPRSRLLMYGLCVGLLVVANRSLFTVLGPLSLPFFWAYFLVGIVSYYAYRQWRGVVGWPLLACVSLALFKVSDQSPGLLPICAWLLFFGLLLEPPTAFTSRFVLPWFDHRAIQYLGRISYSLYLCHWPVLALVHLAFARLGWLGTGPAHLALLFGTTLVLTIGVSAALYHTIEKPGIAVGHWVAARLFRTAPPPAPGLAKAVS